MENGIYGDMSLRHGPDYSSRQWAAENFLALQDVDAGLAESFNPLEEFGVGKDSQPSDGNALDFTNPTFMTPIFSQDVLELSGDGRHHSLSISADVADDL